MRVGSEFQSLKSLTRNYDSMLYHCCFRWILRDFSKKWFVLSKLKPIFIVLTENSKHFFFWGVKQMPHDTKILLTKIFQFVTIIFLYHWEQLFFELLTDWLTPRHVHISSLLIGKYMEVDVTLYILSIDPWTPVKASIKQTNWLSLPPPPAKTFFYHFPITDFSTIINFLLKQTNFHKNTIKSFVQH